MSGTAARAAGAAMPRRGAGASRRRLLRCLCRDKDARALLDYDDLVLKTRDLLRRPGVAPWVLFKLDGGLDHILIDEAQDTNPEQWDVVAALADEFFAGECARGSTAHRVRGRRCEAIDLQLPARRPRGVPAHARAFRERGRGRARALARRSARRVVPLDRGGARRGRCRLRAARGAARRRRSTATPIRHSRAARGAARAWSSYGRRWCRGADAPAPGSRPSTQRRRASRRRAWPGRSPPRSPAGSTGGERLAARDRPIAAGDVMVLVRRRGPFVASSCAR